MRSWCLSWKAGPVPWNQYSHLILPHVPLKTLILKSQNTFQHIRRTLFLCSNTTGLPAHSARSNILSLTAQRSCSGHRRGILLTFKKHLSARTVCVLDTRRRHVHQKFAARWINAPLVIILYCMTRTRALWLQQPPLNLPTHRTRSYRCIRHNGMSLINKVM